MSKKALIIFIKNPILGTVKTRLAATIGDQKALAIYHELLKHTRQIASKIDADKFVFYNRFIDDNDDWNADIFQKKMQAKGDLGVKMKTAFQEIFEEGYQQVVIIGSDCGDLKTKHVKKAFRSLETQKVVLGPAEDGGYYLLGMTQLFDFVFENKSWSTPHLLKETTEELETNETSYQLLKELNDVDTQADWLDWHINQRANMTKKIAKDWLLFHSFMHENLHHPKMEAGFLGMLRYFDGQLKEYTFHEVMQIIRVLADELNGKQKTVDKEIMSAILGILHFGRSWGLHPDDRLQKEKLISKGQAETLEGWLDTISYVVTSLLGGTDVKTAFEFYEKK